MKIAIFSIDSSDDVKSVIDKIFKLSINKNISFHIYSELYTSLGLKGHSLYNNHLDLNSEFDLRNLTIGLIITNSIKNHQNLINQCDF